MKKLLISLGLLILLTSCTGRYNETVHLNNIVTINSHSIDYPESRRVANNSEYLFYYDQGVIYQYDGKAVTELFSLESLGIKTISFLAASDKNLYIIGNDTLLVLDLGLQDFSFINELNSISIDINSNPHMIFNEGRLYLSIRGWYYDEETKEIKQVDSSDSNDNLYVSGVEEIYINVLQDGYLVIENGGLLRLRLSDKTITLDTYADQSYGEQMFRFEYRYRNGETKTDTFNYREYIDKYFQYDILSRTETYSTLYKAVGNKTFFVQVIVDPTPPGTDITSIKSHYGDFVMVFDKDTELVTYVLNTEQGQRIVGITNEYLYMMEGNVIYQSAYDTDWKEYYVLERDKDYDYLELYVSGEWLLIYDNRSEVVLGIVRMQ